MSKGVKQPDGSVCYTGPSCSRHGAHNRWVEMKSTAAPPDWWEESYNDELQGTENFLKETGLSAKAKHPWWHETALRYGFVEIECDSATSLLVKPDDMHSGFASSRRSITVWLVKNGVTVTMMRFLTSPPEKRDYYPETVLCDVETRENHRGNGYALEAVKLAEKHVVDQQIHTNGHYTPEGFSALDGKLPYTKEAVTADSIAIKMGTRREIGVHYRSMNFVHDWDELIKER